MTAILRYAKDNFFLKLIIGFLFLLRLFTIMILSFFLVQAWIIYMLFSGVFWLFCFIKMFELKYLRPCNFFYTFFFSFSTLNFNFKCKFRVSQITLKCKKENFNIILFSSITVVPVFYKNIVYKNI